MQMRDILLPSEVFLFEIALLGGKIQALRCVFSVLDPLFGVSQAVLIYRAVVIKKEKHKYKRET